MSRADCDIRIGTSGWYYDHWKELFYPADLAKNKWFEHYAEHFDTVEINNTFYYLPKESYVARWHKLAPRGFLYAVKANRYITHIKKLKDAEEPLERFFERVGILKGKLGPILYQLFDTKAGIAKILSICSGSMAPAFASTICRARNRLG